MFERYRLHHVGIICPDFEEADRFMATMGLREDYRGFVDPWHCWCIFAAPGDGGTTVELVVGVEGPLRRFNKGAGGVHHMAFEVSDIRQAMDWVRSQGMTMIEPDPIKGAGDFWCNFLSPASTRGIQVELVEPFTKEIVKHPHDMPPSRFDPSTTCCDSSARPKPSHNTS